MTSEDDIVWAMKKELALDAPRLHPWRITDIGVDSDGSRRNLKYETKDEIFYPDEMVKLKAAIV